MDRLKEDQVMDNNERKLSDYIDKLNAEQEPESHVDADSPELNKLFDTVREIRRLRDPVMPETDYPKKLAYHLQNQLSLKITTKSGKRIWITSMASVAAILLMAVVLNFYLPSGKSNIVYAMEEAFKEVKAYHGIVEIIQTNGDGIQTIQGKLEVWADKEERYYIKGLVGVQKDVITVNNGQKKWQVRPDQKEIHVFPVFPDPYRFTFELGKEIEEVKNALSTRIVGEDTIAGRKATILEVSPQGGESYRIWVDKETNLPLQKQSAMQNALQYTITYSMIDFVDHIPEELMEYQILGGFKEININPEQIVNTVEEAKEVLGFTPKTIDNIPRGYIQDIIAINPKMKLVKQYYTINEKENKFVIIQGTYKDHFEPASSAILGKIDNAMAEIQSPVYEDLGILGGGLYAGITDISSIRWQQEDFEYAVVGNASLEELISITKLLTGGTFEILSIDEEAAKPKIEVPVNLEVEENTQKSVDAGSSPWRLDPGFVTQVFVSLKITPDGITRDYPIMMEDLKVSKNNGKEAVVEISAKNTIIQKVYLQRVIRQDSTGIWTVVGYDPVE